MSTDHIESSLQALFEHSVFANDRLMQSVNQSNATIGRLLETVNNMRETGMNNVSKFSSIRQLIIKSIKLETLESD